MNWHFSLIYHVASPSHDLDTMFQYIYFIPIHNPCFHYDRPKLFGITKIFFAFAYKPPTPYRKHTWNTYGQFLCNVRNITASYKLSDIGLYFLLLKFVVRKQTVEPRSSYMNHDQHFTMLIQTMYDV